ncbi:MAG: rod shape-determining protein MreD [bacterium]
MRSRGGKTPKRRWVIAATFTCALLMMVIPYPESLQFARPDWLTLVLFYWCIAIPHRVGIGYGWLLGLLLDLLQHALLGQHAIGKALIALVATSAHPRLRQYHLWQQCMVIAALAAADIAIVAWVYRLAEGIVIRPEYWLTALSTALLWPLVRLALDRARGRAGAGRR